MVNQMSKFSLNIVHTSKPLRALLSTRIAWAWTATQEESFNKLKEEVSSPRVLAFYDTSARTKIVTGFRKTDYNVTTDISKIVDLKY